MAVAGVHPSIEALTAFTLGTLDEEPQASIEAHVAACTSCQERAAVAPADNLVELVRRLGARTGRRGDTFVDTAAQVQTPVPSAAVVLTDALAPFAFPGSVRPEVSEALPPELARHERYRVVRFIGAGGMGAVYYVHHLRERGAACFAESRHHHPLSGCPPDHRAGGKPWLLQRADRRGCHL